MARKIRFPLVMKDGAEARTLEELHEHFDIESILGYFYDGKLKTWLEDRYYDNKAAVVGTLSENMPDLSERICNVFGIEYKADAVSDFSDIQRKKEKLRLISNITADKAILDNINAVALDQNELDSILDSSPERVYLFGEEYTIPYDKKKIHYIGMNTPLINLQEDRTITEYNDVEITFENVRFNFGHSPLYTLGEQLFIDGKYQQAYPLIKEAAESGNARAMYLMAIYYNNCYNVVQYDESNRNKWLEKAQEYNEPLSSYQYAVWNLFDLEEQNAIYAKVVNQIQDMANREDCLAQCCLADMYAYGQGFEKNADKAIQLYKTASNNGNIIAECNLGLFFKIEHTRTSNEGNKTTEGELEHLFWFEDDEADRYDQHYASLSEEHFRKAAETGDAIAQNMLADMYCHRLIGKEMTKEDRNSIALKWYTKSAEQSYYIAEYNLAWFYYKYGEYDLNKTIEWERKAAEHGYVKAQYELGNCLNWGCPDANYITWSTGRRIDDIDTPISWYAKAAEQGNIDAMMEIANCYRDRGANDKYAQYDKAIIWYKKAAELGNDDALFFLGECYSNYPYPPNYDEALNWYMKATKGKRYGAQAEREVGSIYCYGYGNVKKDLDEASKWYQKAVDHGDSNAETLLSICNSKKTLLGRILYGG